MIKVKITDGEKIEFFTEIPVLPKVGDEMWMENVRLDVSSIIIEFVNNEFAFVEIMCDSEYF